MKFIMDNKDPNPETTFSAEATLVTLMNIYDFTNQMMAKVMKDGFRKKEPVKKLTIEITMIADGKEVDMDEIMERYPTQMQLSEKNLAEIILKRAGFGKGGR